MAITAPAVVLAMAGTAAAAVSGAAAASPARTAAQNPYKWGFCSDISHAANCTDVSNQYPNVGWGGSYVGHDEPSLLFYSNRPGSGNNDTYFVRLPKEAPVQPKQNGTGGTDNFMLHPAFWLGMALCDTQSFPNYTSKCSPDTDKNIFNSPNPASPHYIGKHPGTAFMEMQFYPPGWASMAAGPSCSARQWCGALNIDSYSSNPAGVSNNAACVNTVGTEYVNFAFITKNGKAQAPANPLQATAATYTPDRAKDLFMNPGDILAVSLFDTPTGFRVNVNDLTAHTSGSMTASVANQFAEVDFQPKAAKCSITPYAFHPMYSTSSPNTRVPWAAHSYNIAFSDEIGHFEYCAKVNTTNSTCSTPDPGDGKNPSPDDIGCFSAAQSLLYPIGGCTGADNDFDGPPYLKDWPGTTSPRLTAEPYIFTSPTFDGFRQYSRVAFETDMPRIEYANLGGPGPYCDPSTGKNCVNPPPGAKFYPFYTTRGLGRACLWQLGGASIPGTRLKFGGSSRTEYGTSPLALPYATVNSKGQPAAQYKYEDFRRILGSNPC
ncbi:MAG: hypothetical protein JOY82_08645 [Streptosporangiaceae bacterium]|nr:hypothetical protein [Streptosporangiaceae bacterium]MBV9854582.1 hypothetical protein [Streptosporangiaceae bacterium]